MRKQAGYLLAATIAIGSIATASIGSAQAQDKTIKIGGLLPMSGPGAYFGAQDKQGVELALEQLNKSGVNGYKFAVQYEDSACSPLPASQAAKRLIDQYKPDVIIGEECSDATLAIMPIVEQAKVPLINAGSSALKITDPGNPYTFRIMPNEVMQGVDIATQAYNKLNARTAVLLNENTNAGIGNAKVFKDTFEKLGGKVVAEIGFGRDINDFTSIATRVAGLGKVDVIPTYTLEGQGLKITQALAQAGVVKGGDGPAIQLGTIWLPFGFEQKAGKAATGYVRIVQFDPTDQREMVKDFVAAFKAKFNADPTHLHAHAYDQIMLIADVVKRGGTDAQSIRDTLAATKDFKGVTGSVEFDKTNQNIKMDTIHYMETKPDLSWNALKWN
ncbi:MAG: branched-chain amino acid transport system substrate-binding protein [Hyphomicrobiales bacterium]|jgi:branched-chain amino acid transport system substrate-binding protein|nr:branched-chain amino acid transport system substrate-binding protein [Hyphomicrobiales bacterium]